MACSDPSRRIDLPVGEDQPVAFNHTFSSPGDHLVEVQLDPDPLKLDDRRGSPCRFANTLNVLLVDGHFKSEPFQAETDYLAQALNPAADSSGPPSVIRCGGGLRRSVVSPGTRRRTTWSSLCNIAQFTETEVAALDDFLKQGGGVVIFGGDQVVPENYNRLLYRRRQGLLPAADRPQRRRRGQEGVVASASTRSGFATRSSSRSRSESDAVVAGLTACQDLAIPQAEAAERLAGQGRAWRSRMATPR